MALLAGGGGGGEMSLMAIRVSAAVSSNGG